MQSIPINSRALERTGQIGVGGSLPTPERSDRFTDNFCQISDKRLLANQLSIKEYKTSGLHAWILACYSNR